MTTYESTASGILLPREPAPPAPPAEPEFAPPQFGPMEIRDQLMRSLTSAALTRLWQAMELHQSSQIKLPDNVGHDERKKAWKWLAKELLGEDAPQHWEYC